MDSMEKDCLKVLACYGYTGPSAEACVKEWTEKQVVTWGIVKYYEAYYTSPWLIKFRLPVNFKIYYD